MTLSFKNTPNSFLKFGGGIILLIGLAGFFGLIGALWQANDFHNVARGLLGSLMIIGGLTLSAKAQRAWTIALGALATLSVVGTAVVVLKTGTLLAPADLALHLVLACWALSAGIRRGSLPTLTPKGEKV